MSLEQNWQEELPQDASRSDLALRSTAHEPDPRQRPPFFQTAPQPLRHRIRHLSSVALFAFRRSLIPALLLFATVFAGSTYMRVEKADAKITLAYTKAEYAQVLGQPGSIISLVDKKGRLHRISAERLLKMPHVAALAHQTRTGLAHNGLIALLLAGLWLIVSTVRTTRRLL